MPALRFARLAPDLRFGRLEPGAPPQIPYGVSLQADRTRFALWAPRAAAVDLLLLDQRTDAPTENRVTARLPMEKTPEGFVRTLPRRAEGALYMYQLTYPDGSRSQPLPDPRSRYQPEDVHGPSQVIDPERYRWREARSLPTLDRRQLNLYEMHVGTFTGPGTFQAAVGKLDALKDAGYTAIQVMPVKEFAGRWNWGYDMVGFFATENAYGHPDDFKRFVDEAHRRGLRVVLDVVYNHVGPEGNYLNRFDGDFLNASVTPWGEQFNWHQNPRARQFVLDNLTMWLKEFRVDGFRFDMTNFIPDDVLAMMNEHVYRQKSDAILIAEDGRNDNRVTLPLPYGGLGYWGKWNFSYHHHAKSMGLGRSHMGAPTDVASLANLIQRGFPGSDAPMNSLFDGVNFFESHDEVGNHDGQRANVKIDRARFAALSTLKFVIPGIPMTWMGEEYAEKNPFYFFVNYSDPACLAGVRAGRRFSSQPDCTDRQNFIDSKLSWRQDEGIARLNRDLIRLRQTVPALWEGDRGELSIDWPYVPSDVLWLHRRGREHPDDEVVIALNLSDRAFPGNYQYRFPPGRWQEVLNSDDAIYGGSGMINREPLAGGNQSVRLAPWSVQVFRKVSPVSTDAAKLPDTAMDSRQPPRLHRLA